MIVRSACCSGPRSVQVRSPASPPPGPAARGGALLVVVERCRWLAAYDDLYGDRHARGLGGHARALLEGRVTTGMVKLVSLIAAAAIGCRDAATAHPVDAALGTVLVAGSANLVNLFDLRPGRAAKVDACWRRPRCRSARATEARAIAAVAAGAAARGAAGRPGRTRHARRLRRGHARRLARLVRSRERLPAAPHGARGGVVGAHAGQRAGQLQRGDRRARRRCARSISSAGSRREPDRSPAGGIARAALLIAVRDGRGPARRFRARHRVHPDRRAELPRRHLLHRQHGAEHRLRHRGRRRAVEPGRAGAGRTRGGRRAIERWTAPPRRCSPGPTTILVPITVLGLFVTTR